MHPDWGFGGGPVLTGHCQAGLLPLLRLLPPWLQARSPLPKLHSHWPSRDLGSPTLSRAILLPCRNEAISATKGGTVSVWLRPRLPGCL